jgi:hypothetical protein
MINHSTLLAQDTALFYDAIHVNKKGREITTKEFSKEVIEFN